MASKLKVLVIDDQAQRYDAIAKAIEAAGLEDRERLDRHALRHTFITRMARSGVTPKVAQALARHSTINLTMNTYTKLGVSDQAAAVEALPPVPEKKSEATSETLRATGTEGGAAASSGPKKGADSGAKPARKGANYGAIKLAA